MNFQWIIVYHTWDETVNKALARSAEDNARYN